jgi:hypothetical protein
MARFWLATFTTSESRHFAIEVFAEPGRPEYGVLFSTVNDPKQPTELTCLMGFTNGAKACNVWRDRGIPLIDARIESDAADQLTVWSPFFGADPPMQYESPLFALTGIDFSTPAGAPYPLQTLYRQTLEAPDAAQPERFIVRRGIDWTPRRGNTQQLSPSAVTAHVTPTRYPTLAPLETGSLTPVSAWAGDVYLPPVDAGKPSPTVIRVNRADLFGPPAFRFENVEVLGFRIDLGTYGRDFTSALDRLIRPLNFHLAGGAAEEPIWDFRYRAATRVLLIELLRYGRMKQKSPSPPAGIDDFQSQHELLVRLLVGRVDDDTAQGHAPATYVPAIFVDNPWSKLVGRDLQGFDKRMATFWVQGARGLVPLLPDGRVAGPAGSGPREPRPLGDISRVTLVDSTGTPPPADPGKMGTILDLDCSPLHYADWDAFERIDLGLALSGLALSGARWRRSDFDAVEFRRSFAREAVTDSLKGFRSVQVSPVTDRGLESAWITGTFTVDDDFEIARPTGIARLSLHAVETDKKAPTAPSASAYWNLLCEMLGDGRQADISLPTGSWYRLRCSMDLSIDDGLDWARAPS